MIDRETANLETVRSYLAAIEASLVDNNLAQFLTPDAIQIELPNRLNPHGGQSDLSTLLRRAEQGQKLIQHQHFEIISELAQGSRVIVEAVWTGVFAIPFDSLPAGSTMKAHFAMFFELQDGRISLQRNYDCFEAW